MAFFERLGKPNYSDLTLLTKIVKEEFEEISQAFQSNPIYKEKNVCTTKFHHLLDMDKIGWSLQDHI